jgi:hypothetical protein
MTKRSGFGSPFPNSTKNTAALSTLIQSALGYHLHLCWYWRVRSGVPGAPRVPDVLHVLMLMRPRAAKLTLADGPTAAETNVQSSHTEKRYSLLSWRNAQTHASTRWRRLTASIPAVSHVATLVHLRTPLHHTNTSSDVRIGSTSSQMLRTFMCNVWTTRVARRDVKQTSLPSHFPVMQ